jgi:prophage maintenance system killer protein
MSYFFLTTEEIIHIHDTILLEEPGLPGISRDKSLDDETKTKEIIMQVARKELSLTELANWLRIHTVNFEYTQKSSTKAQEKINLYN